MTRIRLVDPDDTEAVAAIYAPVVRETVISFEETPPTPDEMRARIAETLPAHPWLVCEREGRVVGYAYAHAHRSRPAYRWSVDVSVYVHADARGAGVGTALYESLFALLREQGFVNAYAGVGLPNPASVALHESVGFERVGTYEHVGYKHGAWHDVRWFHLVLRDRDERPVEPVSLTVLSTDALDRALAAGEERLG